MDGIQYYAKRLLNPFTGIAQIVETQDARAISTDGINWRLHIKSAIYKMPWRSLVVPHSYDQYLVYGVWSREEGTARVPIHPTLYEEHVENNATRLISALSEYSQDVPFACRDNLELWLLESRQKKPFALIDSKTEHSDFSISSTLSWSATETDADFTTGAFPSRQKHTPGQLSARDMLAELVRKHTGSKPMAIWVERYPDRSGRIVHTNSAEPALENMLLEPEQFPEFFLHADWRDDDSQHLFDDYIIWLSPALLMLPSLEPHQRQELEKMAASRPREVLKHYRLYPDIFDRELINRVLVEAKLRLAGETS